MSATTGMPGGSNDADEGLELVLPGRGVPAGEGVAWIGDGWKVFARSPLMWIISPLILFVLALISALIPLLGHIAFQVLSPVFSAGFIVACRSIERGGEFELEHLFAGFKRHFGSLLVVGLVVFGLSFLILLVFGAFFGFSLLATFLGGDQDQAVQTLAAQMIPLLLGSLVCAVLFIPIVAAYWFAPALVVMHGMAPLAAMRESLMANIRNILPMLLWSIVMFVLLLLGSLPFGLGLLVVVPLMITSSYAAYRSIFTREREGSATGAAMIA